MFRSEFANKLAAKAVTGAEWHFGKPFGRTWRKWIGAYCIDYRPAKKEIAVFRNGKCVYFWHDKYADMLIEAWDSIAEESVGDADSIEKLDMAYQLEADNLVIVDTHGNDDCGAYWLTPLGERFYTISRVS